jgi:hypothetical protein
MIHYKEVSILLKCGVGRRSVSNRQRCADHVVVALTAELRRHIDQPRAAGLDPGVPGSPPRAAVLLLPWSPVAAARPTVGPRSAPPRAPIDACSLAPDRTPLPIARRWPTGFPSPSPSATPDTRRRGGGDVRPCAGRASRCRARSLPARRQIGAGPGPRSAAPWLLPVDRRSAAESAPACPHLPGPAPPVRRDHPGRDGGARSPPGAAAVGQVPGRHAGVSDAGRGEVSSGPARGRRHRSKPSNSIRAGFR